MTWHEGANVITVTVTGADKVTTGAAGTYTVTVTRVASNLSTDTTLSVLTVNDGTADLELDPEFVANRTPVEGGYAAEVASDDYISDCDGYYGPHGRQH